MARTSSSRQETVARGGASIVDRAADADPHRIVAVDTRSNSERTDASASRIAADETIFPADSPSDMTGTGVGITFCHILASRLKSV